MQLVEVSMKKLSLILALAIVLAGGAIGAMSAPSYAQYGYNYPPPPQNSYANPWVGNNTPWIFYRGDWFLNGILQHFFGNQYGWAPYYAYPTTYIVRPNNWYAPQWNAWYQHNPHYWQSFEQKYPYWRGHRVGQTYDQNFYNKYHRGQGEGWNQGFHGVRAPGVVPGHDVRSPGTAPGHDVRRGTAPAPDVRRGAAPAPDVRRGTAPAPDVRRGTAPAPDVRRGAAPGQGGQAPANGKGVSQPGKTPPAAEKKHQE